MYHRPFYVIVLLLLVSISPIPSAQARDGTLPLPGQNRDDVALITNASFEIDSDADGIPDGWTGKKTDQPNVDSQTCNTPDKVVANSGECTFAFDGNPDGKGSKLQQNLADISSIANGSKISLSAFVDAKGVAPDTRIADLTVNLSDGSKLKLELRVPNRSNYGYIKLKNSLLVNMPNGIFPTDAQLTLRYGASDGKFLIDDVNLKVVQKTPFSPMHLVAIDGGEEDYFGYSVSLSANGNTALVGASQKDHNQGAVYVYVRSGGVWSLQQVITANNGKPADYFGFSVSLSADGNTALIGAYGFTDYSYQGSAYVFVRSGGVWTQQQQLLASDGEPQDNFGISVSLSADGNTALIGAHGDGIDEKPGQGSAYIFVRADEVWAEIQKLSVEDGESYDRFGGSVSLNADGSVALIGASWETVGANTSQGSAYIFVRTGDLWIKEQELIANDLEAKAHFGKSVSLSANGSIALVGANGDTVGVNAAQGSAYIFVRDNGVWTQQHHLFASDGDETDLFGAAVSLSADGNTALIGATYWVPSGSDNADKGRAYVFTKKGVSWSERKLLALDREPRDYFGHAVSLSPDGSTALIGVDHDDINGEDDQGSAWVFDLR